MFTKWGHLIQLLPPLTTTTAALLGGALRAKAQAAFTGSAQLYEFEETRQLVALVNHAADLISSRGESAFSDFRVAGSRWQRDHTYIAVLDLHGDMLVHPDPALEGKNVIDLKDINGKPIIRGIIRSVTSLPNKTQGWYHYQWPVPAGLLPRWKSTYSRMVVAPSGTPYIVLSGIYNDRMERSFVIDQVMAAVAEIEKHGEKAFPLFHDPTGPFIAKDAYIFVYDSKGVNLVLPAFPNLEGRELLEMKDTHGKQFIREMLRLVESKGSGWVDYMWPKPGESEPTQKSAYVSRAKLGSDWVLVGCGVYLADAPKAAQTTSKMRAPELMNLVREAAALFEKRGESAFPEFRQKGSKWLRDHTYFFVWNMEGTSVFHAADRAREGQDDTHLRDIAGRPIEEMAVDASAGPSGEGWIHYMYPEPGSLFPSWKSTFVKRVTFPSGTQYMIGCGIYQMEMDKAFIEDVVDRAATLVAAQGKQAFPRLRDKIGRFVFMDTYVFVVSPEGIELVNAAQPTLEGRSVLELKDLKGSSSVRDEIEAAMKNGSAWLTMYWYRPGSNAPALKQTFVRKVQFGEETYIVGSGYYANK